jgi:hypothetical protein
LPLALAVLGLIAALGVYVVRPDMFGLAEKLGLEKKGTEKSLDVNFQMPDEPKGPGIKSQKPNDPTGVKFRKPDDPR